MRKKEGRKERGDIGYSDTDSKNIRYKIVACACMVSYISSIAIKKKVMPKTNTVQRWYYVK